MGLAWTAIVPGGLIRRGATGWLVTKLRELLTEHGLLGRKQA
ncbi:hypothetical protein Y88_0075 [Novosphingobium nitrogenifigens DSM 19370]|uniref:Uncharacterized protein n=1 Tax=Novosphingobium nitrogenifigens DSM 19370 TaxID=983920 RepID=F1Z4N6_9SPHN|nr:hypothetical protein Y88_0075 [Novosphingobium nitrogenifigens DSM 19370]